MTRYLCVHGHFYQPPRENPWLEQIEMQDSAYPYHDWNARITAECYSQNAASRILDATGKIADIVNNYARISFNFGPTLLSWLEAHDPATYRALQEADRESRLRFSGHGSACAQVYNHMILPLANLRDKVTQVRWGVRDFEHRFGRFPEGMWLPETAVDTESLEVLAEQGIRFTILSPYQAKRVRKIGATDWQDVQGGAVNPQRAYRVQLPSGRNIAVFFYDGPSSRAVAFERLLHSGEAFAGRLLGALEGAGRQPALEHIATDGETYGHHHRHGDMALAYALSCVERSGVQLTVYGEFLERHPPEFEAQIVERTAWSCAHGVSRWASDCGCNTGGNPTWNQAWRAPLRAALDWLRDRTAAEFERRGRELFIDPWRARDDYIEIILDRGEESLARFFLRHARGDLGAGEKVTALKLLELQRHVMYAYTSCGWFFDDIGGIETVQVIQYAARAVQLAHQLFGLELETELLLKLEHAKSNVPALGTGRTIYETSVRPSMLDLHSVVAHWAVSSLFEDAPETRPVFCYEITQDGGRALSSGRMQLKQGRATARSNITLETQTVKYAALHLGDHHIAGGVREFVESDGHEAAAEEVASAFSKGDIPAVIRLFDRYFRDRTFSLSSLFSDRQREVTHLLLRETVENAEATYLNLYDQVAPLLLFLCASSIRVPGSLHLAAEQALNIRLRNAFMLPEFDSASIISLTEEAKARKVAIDARMLSFAFTETLKGLSAELTAEPQSAERFGRLVEAVRLRRVLPFEVELWSPQNLYFRLKREVIPDMRRRAAAFDDEAKAWLAHFEAAHSELDIAGPTF